MMEGDLINVVLPLRLEWLPTYRLQAGQSVQRGSLVKVSFAHKDYVGYVYGLSEERKLSEVLPVIEVLPLTSISEDELAFWDFISSYYLCSKGEVFKYAFTSCRIDSELKPCRKAVSSSIPVRTHLSDNEKACLEDILNSFQEKRPVLLQGGADRQKIYNELAVRTLKEGRNVLVLRSSLPESDPFRTALTYFPSQTPAQRKAVINALRTQDAQIVVGTKSALFLPWKNLGLIIVDNEQSAAHKQSLIAPRFNARDCALALAVRFGAEVLLGSEAPSLESVYNCRTGKFTFAKLPEGKLAETLIIDTFEEKRKNGMIGSFSRVLLSMMSECIAKGSRILLLQPWKNTDDAEIEARTHFPKAGSKINALPLSEADCSELGKYSLVVLLNAEFMLSKQDFRADERTYQAIEGLKRMCDNLVIQTSRVSPAFDGSLNIDTMLSERKTFSLPPFTRELRLCRMMRSNKGLKLESAESIFLAKNADLATKKAQIQTKVGSGIIIDVDPA